MGALQLLWCCIYKCTNACGMWGIWKKKKYKRNGNVCWSGQWLPLLVSLNSAAVWKQVLKKQYYHSH